MSEPWADCAGSGLVEGAAGRKPAFNMKMSGFPEDETSCVFSDLTVCLAVTLPYQGAIHLTEYRRSFKADNVPELSPLQMGCLKAGEPALCTSCSSVLCLSA